MLLTASTAALSRMSAVSTYNKGFLYSLIFCAPSAVSTSTPGSMSSAKRHWLLGRRVKNVRVKRVSSA